MAVLVSSARAADAGLEVVAFPLLARVEVAGEPVVASYLNLYLSDAFALVPTLRRDGRVIAAFTT